MKMHNERSGRAMAATSGSRRVVIIGGGFAGLFAARRLKAPLQVTLIDRAEHHLFQPLLYQCATGILSQGKIASPLRALLSKHHNVEFVLAEVTGIDAAAKTVTARRPLGEEIEFGYDYLILAAGMRQSYFGHDEYAEFAPGMKSIEDAMRIRRRVFGAFELAESATDPDERKRWLTFALVGAGPTGVELAGQIRELATKTLAKEYRHIQPRDARVMLFDGGHAPLAMFGPKLSGLAARELKKLGVELHMGSIVTEADLDSIHVKDLTLPGHPEILVTGDLMSLDKLPGVAEVAMQTGLYAARKIRHEARGHIYDKPFKYRDLGSAAYISRGHAVVSAFGLNFGGFIGWWVWLFIHIGFLTGYRNRVGAVLGWWFAFARDLRRERTFTIDDLPAAVGAYSSPPDS